MARARRLDADGNTHGRASARRFAPDLLDDRPIRWVNRTFPFWVGMTLFLPFLLGFVLSGFSLVGGAAGASCGAGSCGSSCCTT